MFDRKDIPEDLGYRAMYAPPIRKDGKLYRGVLSCDSPELLKYLRRELWVVLHLDHYARPPPELPYVDLYQIDPFYADRIGNRPYVHAINRDFVDPAYYTPLDIEKKYDVIFNSAWTALKRHHLFVEGLINAKQRGRPVSVLMMGYHHPGYTSPEIETSVREAIEKHGLAVDIMDTEWDTAKVNIRYNLCRCAVHTSRTEAGPKILPEAALAGLPYLTTSDTNGGSPKYVSLENGNGLTFEPKPEAMAEAMWWALDNPNRFAPRRWALSNMSKPVGEKRLRDALTRVGAALGYDINIEGVQGTDEMVHGDVFEAEAAVLAG